MEELIWWSRNTALFCFNLKKRAGLDFRKKLITVRVVRYWHRLTRGVVDALFLEMLKARMNGDLGNLIFWKVSLPKTETRNWKQETRYWNKIILSGSFQPKPFYDSLYKVVGWRGFASCSSPFLFVHQVCGSGGILTVQRSHVVIHHFFLLISLQRCSWVKFSSAAFWNNSGITLVLPWDKAVLEAIGRKKHLFQLFLSSKQQLTLDFSSNNRNLDSVNK